MTSRRNVVLIAVGAALAVGGTGVAAVLGRGAAGGARSPAPAPAQTASVTRQTLVQQDTIDGTLGYAGGYSIAGTGTGAGLLTWLPSAGRVIGQGEAVYKANNVPVPLFRGTTPFWRPLASGTSDGVDVRELEQNLADLGFFHRTPNKAFTAATATAIRKWQKSLDLPETGRVEPGAVVMLPGDIRVTSVTGMLGQPAQGKILDASGTRRIVTVRMPVDKQAEAKLNGMVTVTMPDGGTVQGKVSAIGTVASKPDQNGPGAGTGPTVNVTVDLGAGAPVLDQAPVQVAFVARKKEDVLTVPVSALLALAEGGYGLQAVTPGGGRKIVAVTTGMYAQGKVEVSGAGVRDGMKVTVASE
ncbi:peptidoglycan-binding domain-containing protein [Fodinicola acaciae]|uniref:peptidoglycan-binding domain-containing protein n=1 Tax=Fodinicola acaciae TaxID=2681555 RepID=UPI0013D28142|nr:peptidoglycan-binding domain-containing protein [Fodinicola acaciae]